MTNPSINVKLEMNELAVILEAVNGITLKGHQAILVGGVLQKVIAAGDTLNKKVAADKVVLENAKVK